MFPVERLFDKTIGVWTKGQGNQIYTWPSFRRACTCPWEVISSIVVCIWQFCLLHVCSFHIINLLDLDNGHLGSNAFGLNFCILRTVAMEFFNPVAFWAINWRKYYLSFCFSSWHLLLDLAMTRWKSMALTWPEKTMSTLYEYKRSSICSLMHSTSR